MSEFEQLEGVLDSLRSEMEFTYKKLPGQYDPVYFIKFDHGSIDGGDRFILNVCVRFRPISKTTKEEVEALIRERVREVQGSTRLPS